MRKHPYLFFLFVVAICGQSLAQNPAGVALYFRTESEVYLLLADHATRPRGWATYGGGRNEGETTADTAARETEEETRGYFSRIELLEKINSQEPVMDNGFALYFAEVDFVPAQRVSNHEPPSDGPAYLERGPYAWIPYSVVEKQIKIAKDGVYPLDSRYLPTDRKTDWMWPLWIGTMRIAIENDVLPWIQSTDD